MAREDLHFRLRLPEALKAAVEQAAEENRRSMTAEIVTRLEQSFEEPLVLPDYLVSRIAPRAKQRKITLRAEIIETLEAAYPHGMQFGEFVEKWAVPVTWSTKAEDRARLIEAANQDREAEAGGLSLEETQAPDGSPVIDIYLDCRAGRERVASLRVVEV
jgi:hypothetical protein